jgi:electron transfer flavoprotein alpha subunit
MKILAIALQKEGQITPVSYEVIEAAKSLGAEHLTAILAENAEGLAQELAGRGGGNVLAVSDGRLKQYNDEIYARTIAALVVKHSPDLVLGPATSYGKALFGRLAAVCGGGMVSDITGISEQDGSVVATRPSYGGSVVAQISSNGDGPLFVTVRPKIFSESSEGDGTVVVESVDPSCFESRSEIKEIKSESTGTLNLAEADVIVSAGRGIKGPENVDLVKELAASVGGAFGSSRAIVDAGWVPYATQVGQTGRTVNPKLYIAVGISGAIQHLVGMQSSRTIVAINRDKDAPIFNIASYGIVGDLFEIVPALSKKFKEELGT